MNSFFDVFKWDRFVAPSAMELLFWLVSVMILLGGVFGLVTGIGMAEAAPLPGLILIAVSVIGTLAGIIIARIICETVVILFRVNENLMDIAERGVTGLPMLAPARLEDRSERRDRPVERAEREADIATPIDLDAEVVLAEVEIAETTIFQPAPAAEPAAGRVEPTAWDVKPVEPRAPDVKPVESRVEEARPAELRPAEPRIAETRTAAQRPVPSRPAAPPIVIVDAEVEPAEPAPTPSRRDRRAAAPVQEEEAAPIITPPPPRRTRPERSPAESAPWLMPDGATEPPIDHALRRLANGPGVDAIRAASEEATRRSIAEQIEAEARAIRAAAEEDLEADDEDLAAYLEEEAFEGEVEDDYVDDADFAEPEPILPPVTEAPRRGRSVASVALPRARGSLTRLVHARLVPEAEPPMPEPPRPQPSRPNSSQHVTSRPEPPQSGAVQPQSRRSETQPSARPRPAASPQPSSFAPTRSAPEEERPRPEPARTPVRAPVAERESAAPSAPSRPAATRPVQPRHEDQPAARPRRVVEAPQRPGGEEGERIRSRAEGSHEQRSEAPARRPSSAGTSYAGARPSEPAEPPRQRPVAPSARSSEPMPSAGKTAQPGPGKAGSGAVSPARPAPGARQDPPGNGPGKGGGAPLRRRRFRPSE